MTQSLRVHRNINSVDDSITIQHHHRDICDPAILRENSWEELAPGELNLDLLTENRIVGHSRGSEALHFDVLRSRTLGEMRKQNWRKLAIVSPTSRCGKTNVALNLAMSFSKQLDNRTILLDFNFRAPAISKLLGISNGPALSSCIQAQEEFATIGKRFGSSLAVAGDDHPVDMKSNILCRKDISRALTAIDHRYQPKLMLFDTPPMLQFHDIADISPHIDCVLLVIDAQTTTAREVELCERDLARQTNVLGIILNKCHESVCEYKKYPRYLR